MPLPKCPRRRFFATAINLWSTLTILALGMTLPTANLLAIDKLQLVKALPLAEGNTEKGITDLHPSGLAYCNHRLLMVSDRHDRHVFQLQISLDKAIYSTYRHLTVPAYPNHKITDKFQQLVTGKRFDWEGISCHRSGIYLLSEQYNNVLYVTDRETDWLDLPRADYVGQQGILTRHNAGLEGISWHSDGRLLLAAERNARGLLELSHRQTTAPATFPLSSHWQLDKLATPLEPIHDGSPERIADFSGLAVDSSSTYSLERNLFKICRRDDDFKEASCWSYAHVELAEELRYQSTYGVAEGIAVDNEYIYLVTDNNEKPLVNAPNDRRPRLWIFSKPSDWEPTSPPKVYSKP